MGTIKQDDYPPDLLGLWAAHVARERQATLVMAVDEGDTVGLTIQPLRATVVHRDGTRGNLVASRYEAAVAIGLAEQDEPAPGSVQPGDRVQVTAWPEGSGIQHPVPCLGVVEEVVVDDDGETHVYVSPAGMGGHWKAASFQRSAR